MYPYPANKHGKSIAFLLVAVLFVTSISCITDKDDYRDFKSAPLFGMVYDKDNQPCSGVYIAVDGEKESSSDVNGRFIIAYLTKGSHIVRATKEGYEPFEVSIDFLNKTQVLYLQIISTGQLLRKAEDSLDQKNLLAAEKSLERARAIDPGNPVLHYLTAVYSRQMEEYGRAVESLEMMLSSGYRTPAVYLLLADIYQYDLENIESAAEYLSLLLKIRPDKAIQQRYEDLMSFISG